MDSPDRTADAHRSKDTLFVVGLGASAGGITALKNFFRHVPATSGAAYAVVLHLSPDYESRLAEVLQQVCAMPVRQVHERVLIEPNHVYVIPPNRLLGITQGHLAEMPITRLEQRRAPVDMFFRSLAEAQGSRAVCVVLSGTGPNGSSGLKRVKEYGGLAIAQDPNEAEYGDMPRNSIATGLVDLVLPVGQMPERIAAFRDRLQADGGDAAPTDPEAIREVLTLLRVRTGHDFTHYKPGTVQRRIDRRLHLRGLSSLGAYARFVRENPDEAVALMKELLIGVTNFFRDGPAFEALARRVIPLIYQGKREADQVRVWVPACATGEEAYSIAMLLVESAPEGLDRPAVQLFATDLDERNIALAREGLYAEAGVADLTEERLHRFFVRDAGGYRIRRELRETVLFAHHNVVRDPPFSHLDLISCRNLLIYLNRAIQEKVIETFHFALRPGGFLFLGGSESPDSTADLFTAFDKAAHIYASRSVSSRPTLGPVDPPLTRPRPVAQAPEPRSPDRMLPVELHQRLLESYAPPSVVVTDEHNVVHMSESVGRYLRVAGGEPTRDLLRLVRDELRPDLRSALFQAAREHVTVEVSGMPAALDTGERTIDIVVHPVPRESEVGRGYLLVTFSERGDDGTARRHPPCVSAPLSEHLEEERQRLKVQLRSTIEQYETQVEEVKAANEELQAMNEELRSVAEELETSKEELQSVNEELTTVNQELKIKIDELRSTNDDFQNLINSSGIGTIFLDRDLRVKLCTPAANQTFNLRESDIGRPLSDITSRLTDNQLHQDVQQVLAELGSVERSIQTLDNRWIGTRVRPYRTTDNRIEGVVITLEDITARHRAEEKLRQGEERLRLLIDSAIDYAIFTMTAEGIIDSWNPGAERMFGYDPQEIIGRHFDILFTAEDRKASVPEAELANAFTTGRAIDERFHLRRDGARFYCSGVTTRLGEAMGFAKIARDLSPQQAAAEALRLAHAQFDARVRERTGELEAEISTRTAAQHNVTDLLKKVVTAQEVERARIARELHDQFGQQLTALRLTLEQCRDRLDSAGGVPAEVRRALTLADELDRGIDFLAWELRPAVLDDVGLAAALPRFVREWSSHHGVPAEYRAHQVTKGLLSSDAEVAFYRIAQEALNNVSKHAHASRVDVLLESTNGTIGLIVEDDGIGFETTDPGTRDKGIGLAGMQERAASIGAALHVESAHGQGTSVFLRCPARDGAPPTRARG